MQVQVHTRPTRLLLAGACVYNSLPAPNNACSIGVVPVDAARQREPHPCTHTHIPLRVDHRCQGANNSCTHLRHLTTTARGQCSLPSAAMRARMCVCLSCAWPWQQHCSACLWAACTCVPTALLSLLYGTLSHRAHTHTNAVRTHTPTPPKRPHSHVTHTHTAHHTGRGLFAPGVC
jgi:hypothetical protein